MLHTNDDFLKAIAADPHEFTLRLAYADWLAEHDDHDRAELIRVEEEMRLVPVFADRFWELKPRRNQLRTLAGVEWCGQMRYGTECEPVFRHGIPDGWRERWRLIREFTERWHRVPMPDIGGRQAEIAEAETRLGRTLPPSVREWIAFAHDTDVIHGEFAADGRALRHSEFEGAIRVFRNDPPSEEYQVRETRDFGTWSLAATTFLVNPNSGTEWAVRNEHLHIPDPPVSIYDVEFQSDDYELVKRADAPQKTVTEFILRWGLDRTYGDPITPIRSAFNDPTAALRELVNHFGPPARFGDCLLFAKSNVLVVVEIQIEVPKYFRLICAKPLPREEIPSLWHSSVDDPIPF